MLEGRCRGGWGGGGNGNTYIAFEGWAEPSSYSRRHPHLYNPKISYSYLSNKLFFFNLEDVPSNTPRRMAQPTADPNADLGPATLNFGQPTPREHRSIPRQTRKKLEKKQGLTPKRQTTTRQETRDDGIPRILFLPIPLDRTIKS